MANLELEELQARLDQSEGGMGTQAQGKLVDQRVGHAALAKECDDLRAQVGVLSQANEELKAQKEQAEEDLGEATKLLQEMFEGVELSLSQVAKTREAEHRANRTI